MTRRVTTPVAALAIAFTFAFCAAPPPARALNVAKPICTLAGLVSGIAGKVCSAASHAGSALKAGKKLLGGHLGGAIETLSGGGTAAKALTAGVVVASLVAWVAGGAKVVLNETASVISTTTRPQLQSTWFSSTYWRMAAISALLTLPFLFAAAVQAVMRSDMAMLLRSALGYLPLGLLSVSIAAPLTTLLLASSDELSSIVSGASGNAGARFLSHVGFVSGTLSHLSGSTFVLLFAGLLTVTATITLWIELLIRSAAVYVVVLMLPLFFAALVWPARRMWAVRAVEVLVALIISKFAIVAVLSLGGAALGHTAVPSATQMLEGATLVMLAAFSPWALLRLLPLHELTGGLDGLRSRPQLLESTDARAQDASEVAQALVRQLPAQVGSNASAAPDGPRPADIAGRAFDDSRAGGDGSSGVEMNGDRATGGDAGRSGAGAGSGEGGIGDGVGSNGDLRVNGDRRSDADGAQASPVPAPVADGGPGSRRREMEPIWQSGNFSWQEIAIDGPTSPPEPIPRPPDEPASLALEPSGDGPSAFGPESPPAELELPAREPEPLAGELGPLAGELEPPPPLDEPLDRDQPPSGPDVAADQT
jgi:hypothetical protein